MESEAGKRIVSFAVPGGIIVLGAPLLLWTGILPIDERAALGFYLFTVAAAGALLAWRFRSSRALYAFLVLLLADRLISWLGNTHPLPEAVRNTGLDLVTLLLPCNFLLLARWRERGLSVNTFVPKLAWLAVQVTVVGLLCRPEQVINMHWLRAEAAPGWLLRWTQLPQLVLLVTIGALVVITVSWWSKRRPLENAWFWALVACMLAARTAMVPPVATFYFATAAVVLVLALVDTSYLLAYHDELTGIPARRAFNETGALLQEPYTIAMVDVDHFKRFNDTFGHETGDQVLRMVAGRLSRVGGGGRSYRCGGEEFGIVFGGKNLAQALPYLEALRQDIEETRFIIRGPDRSRRRRPERRYHPAERRGSPARSVSVTASFGVAEPSPGLPNFEQVVNAADQALYRAKEEGRNRVEVWGPRLAKRAKQVLSK